jgi:hypothetical protein
MIRLERWVDNQELAYIFDTQGVRSTVAFVENDDCNHSAFIKKVIVTEEVDALLNRFAHIRPCQCAVEDLVYELKLFLACPDAYEVADRNTPCPEVLRFLGMK